ncbi:MAG: hypothetical protein JRI85_17325 [Deltaproteobacteria bacterium]|nr:hypothetical protein [Deltaproteobacteria bacterium]
MIRAKENNLIRRPEKSITHQLFVTGQLKIGLFTLSFEDLTVPLYSGPLK